MDPPAAPHLRKGPGGVDQVVAEAGAGSSLDPACLVSEASHHPNLRPFLVAARASAGDSEAQVFLELLLVDESELVRTRALEAAPRGELGPV